MENTTKQEIPQTTSHEPDYAMGAIAYLTMVGLIVAFVSNKDKKDEFVSYHVRQALGLVLTHFAVIFLSFIPYIGNYVPYFGSLALLVLWILGLVNAVNKKMLPVPVLGEKYNEWFKNI